MTPTNEYGYCDVCGATATNLARDVFRHEPVGAPNAYFSPGPLHKGCDAHPAQSKEYSTELVPMVGPVTRVRKRPAPGEE